MPTAFVVRERVPSFRKELLVALRGIAGCLPAAAGPRRGDPDHAAARLGPRAPVAQGIERAPPEREVAGSIPARRITILSRWRSPHGFAGQACQGCPECACGA